MFKELLHNCLLKGLRFSTTSSRKPTFGVRIFILTYERFTKKRPCSQFSLSPNTIETNCGQIMNEKAPKPKRSRAIGNTSLSGRKPEEVAALIIKKLEDSGVELSAQFAYSDEAKADVDFPRADG